MPKPTKAQRITPDTDGGMTCPCGCRFSFKVWFRSSWECPKCEREFHITPAGREGRRAHEQAEKA